MTVNLEVIAATGEALAQATGQAQAAHIQPEALLEDLGVDSLTLLELVEALQVRLAIVVPDEVTARIRTVADLQDAVGQLVAAPSSETIPKGTRS
ncbi:acyl carrier protein [Streptomyces sp. SRF1]|uniref:acyl carrier protein n=1 Tax=Streptomyces sp. SRF1 TaxID=1549642 RepID=UPI0025B11873|nr:acyl carrier protein [Streptomyces sp. SRF1]MDN3059384.1 acyl carrier protein [Streptomyces sp. SRF1]